MSRGCASLCDVCDAPLKLGDDVDTIRGAAERISDAKDIVPDVVETPWM